MWFINFRINRFHEQTLKFYVKTCVMNKQINNEFMSRRGIMKMQIRAKYPQIVSDATGSGMKEKANLAFSIFR